MFRRIVLIPLVVAFSMLFAGVSTAAPISADSGTMATFAMVPSAGSTYTLSFTGGSTTTENALPVGPFATGLANLIFDVPGVHMGSQTVYTFHVPVANAKIINQGAGAANFTYNTITGFVPDATPQFFNIVGTESLVSNTTGADFSPFTLGNPNNNFTISLQLAAGNFNTEIGLGHSITGNTASFSQNAGTPPPPPAEPASLAIFALMGVGGAIVARRRLRAAKSAVK